MLGRICGEFGLNSQFSGRLQPVHTLPCHENDPENGFIDQENHFLEYDCFIPDQDGSFLDQDRSVLDQVCPKLDRACFFVSHGCCQLDRKNQVSRHRRKRHRRDSRLPKRRRRQLGALMVIASHGGCHRHGLDIFCAVFAEFMRQSGLGMFAQKRFQ